MRVGQSYYPPVIGVPQKKPFWKYAAIVVVGVALFAGIGVMLAWRG